MSTKTEMIQIDISVTRVTTIDGVIQPDSRDEGSSVIAGYIDQGFFCDECDKAFAECEEEKLYECNECSTKFPQSEGGGRNGNVCPECTNKFGSKIADRFCSECRESEVNEVEIIVCPNCDTAIVADDWVQHMKDDHLDEMFTF